MKNHLDFWVHHMHSIHCCVPVTIGLESFVRSSKLLAVQVSLAQLARATEEGLQ